MDEEYWTDLVRMVPKGQLAYSFVLDFQYLPREAVEHVRATAEQLLREQGAGRSLVTNTARTIAQLCTVRLGHPESPPASHYLVQVGWSKDDDEEAVRGDCGRIIQWAKEMANEERESWAGTAWGGIVDGFLRGPRPT
jgi:hypothetical protein